jgi:hypothetical protein
LLPAPRPATAQWQLSSPYLQRSMIVASGVQIALSARFTIGHSVGLVAAAPPLSVAPPLAAPARPMPPRPAASPPLAGAPARSIVSPPEDVLSPATESPPAVALPEPAVLELSPAALLLLPAVPSELSPLEPPHDALSTKPAMSTKPKPHFSAFIEIFLGVTRDGT